MSKLLELLKLSVKEVGHVKRMNQADIAKAIETMPQQLSKQLGGKTDARISLLDKIANALGVPPFYLLMNAEERAKWDQKSNESDQDKIEILQQDVAAIKKIVFGLDQKADECKQTILSSLTKS